MPSPSLSLYLLAARRPAPGPRPDWPPRPETETMVWIDPGAGSSVAGLVQLARRMQGSRADLGFVVTAAKGLPLPEGFPEGTVVARRPADRLPDLAAFLDRYRPALILLTGADLPPALIHAATRRGIAVALADLSLPETAPPPWRWGSGMAAALLRRLDPILVADRATERALARIAGAGLPVHVTGRIEATMDPPGHDEAERAALSELIEARPVWLAADLPEAEEEAVIAAHALALRFAHRALLILSPADPARGPALVVRLADRGLEAALRSADEDPDADVQVLIADLPGELGLWYRLAPVSYLGGTLAETGPRRAPAEAAALGSAILHGPRDGGKGGVQGVTLADLDAAGAACRVADAAALAEALADLLAPDRAAQLALRAWTLATAGAEVRESAMQLLFQRLDPGRGGG